MGSANLTRAEIYRILSLCASLLLLTLLLVACGNPSDRKAQYLEQGKRLFQQGNYVKAELEFKNVLQIDPKDLEAIYMLGEVATRRENWRRAFAAYTKVLTLEPRHLPALVKRGQLFRITGATYDALEAVKSALLIEPENVDALLLRAITRNQIGMKQEAIQDAEYVLTLESGNIYAFALLVSLLSEQGEVDKAVALTKQMIGLHPDNAGLHRTLAKLYRQAGESDLVLEQLRKVIAVSPEDLQGWTQLAAFYVRAGDQEQAEQVFRDAIEAIPEPSEAKLKLIELLANRGDLELAEQQLLDFIWAEPENHRLRFGLADLYRATGKAEKVKRVYREIMDPDDMGLDSLDAHVRLARILFAEGKLDETAELLDKVLNKKPGDKDALLIRAGIALFHRQADQAVADIHRVLGSAPNKPEEFALLEKSSYNVKALRLLAGAYTQTQQVPLAKQALEAAIMLEPKAVPSNLQLAQLLVETGDASAAVAVLERLLQTAPYHYEALRLLGMIQLGESNWSRLEVTAAKLKSKYPEKPVGYHFMGLAYRGQKRLDRSLEEFKQAQRLQPGAVGPLLEMAKTYLVRERPEQALEQLQQLLESNPGNPLAMELQGKIYLSQQRLGEAEETFRELVAEHPGWSTPYSYLTALYLSRNESQAAIDLLRQGIEAAQGDPSLSYQLADRYLEAGRNEAAMAQYEAILATRPEEHLAANNLALLLLGEQPDQSRLDRALKLVVGFENIENPIYLDTLGWVRYRRGEYDRAVAVLERTVSLPGKLAEHDYHLGMAYYRQGHLEKAENSLQAALESGDDESWREEARRTLQSIRH